MQYFDNNANLKSELRKISYSYDNVNFIFNSDLGVFSKNHIDDGSNLLLDAFIKNTNNNINVLDVGCGIGFLGIVLAKYKSDLVTMIDVNRRALHLTEMNLKENGISAKVIESNIYESINEKYDAIITNPPIRAGKSVYLTIINDAFNYLNDNGELWFVMRTNHGVKTVIKNLKEKYNVLVVNKDSGFYIVKVTK